ncbi:MAG TPA: hypothetical protein VHG08_04065 [Longimicrobium sp.]|nr:hypothetical protein [Longimicrobium sp.]
MRETPDPLPRCTANSTLILPFLPSRSERWISAGAVLPLLLPVLTHAQQAQVRLERVLSLGGDHGPREAIFADVADIATTPSGEVYVLDVGTRR